MKRSHKDLRFELRRADTCAMGFLRSMLLLACFTCAACFQVAVPMRAIAPLSSSAAISSELSHRPPALAHSSLQSSASALPALPPLLPPLPVRNRFRNRADCKYPSSPSVCHVCPSFVVAHHVQKKATRGHNAYRPRKSRPSDIYRKPPSYPALPDLPVFTKIDGPSSHSRQTVTIEIAPEDTAETLRAKVTAAGGAAPEEFTYAGQALTSSLGDLGLDAAKSVEADVISK